MHHSPCPTLYIYVRGLGWVIHTLPYEPSLHHTSRYREFRKNLALRRVSSSYHLGVVSKSDSPYRYSHDDTPLRGLHYSRDAQTREGALTLREKGEDWRYLPLEMSYSCRVHGKHRKLRDENWKRNSISKESLGYIHISYMLHTGESRFSPLFREKRDSRIILIFGMRDW